MGVEDDMTDATTDELRYPVGKHDALAPVTQAQVEAAIRDIRELPAHLRAAVHDLDEEQLNVPYRPGGWTIRQLAHHLADSHVNAHTRLRLALTEERPVIRPYDEQRWAELADAKTLPVAPSLALLEGLHLRWSHLLDALSPADFERRLLHPDLGVLSVAQLTCLYGWHSRHHVAHATSLRERMGWSRGGS